MKKLDVYLSFIPLEVKKIKVSHFLQIKKHNIKEEDPTHPGLQTSKFQGLRGITSQFSATQGHADDCQTTNLIKKHAVPDRRDRSAWESQLLQGEIMDGPTTTSPRRPTVDV